MHGIPVTQTSTTSSLLYLFKRAKSSSVEDALARSFSKPSSRQKRKAALGNPSCINILISPHRNTCQTPQTAQNELSLHLLAIWTCANCCHCSKPLTSCLTFWLTSALFISVMALVTYVCLGTSSLPCPRPDPKKNFPCRGQQQSAVLGGKKSDH